jgi:hypothetical protein
MIDIEDITRQVRRNCTVSDARHAGLYSICGLALRLRDLFKWEHDLPPWVEKEPVEVLEWIDAKEQLWESVAESPYAPLDLEGQRFEPFDTAAVNELLGACGLFYGAGYAYSLKPTFLLARLETCTEVDGHGVCILGPELARDLLTIPAFSQDDRIILRRQAAMMFLWDQIFYVKKSGRRALKFALFHCGLKDQSCAELQQRLPAVFARHQESYIYHELGELKDAVFPADTWREIIASFPHSPIELAARALKDLLADTGEPGTLQRITTTGNTAALGFYAAFLDGLAKEFFPELSAAFETFIDGGDWRCVEAARRAGHERARAHAETMMAIYAEGKRRKNMRWAAAEIERRLLGNILKRTTGESAGGAVPN